MFKRSIQTLSAAAAASLDQELMSTGHFSIDQLMELAGLAVAKAITTEFPAKDKGKVVFLIGPGNNGGDGLVAARHLKLWGYHDPILYYPKKSTKNQLYINLEAQLKDLKVEEVESIEEMKSLLTQSASPVKLIVDALFGFSFKPPIRAPFDELTSFLSTNHGKIASIVSIDIPSGWDVDLGPLEEDIKLAVLINLTAPKPCAALFSGTQYLGGRFINPTVARKYGIEELTKLYKGDDLITKL